MGEDGAVVPRASGIRLAGMWLGAFVAVGAALWGLVSLGGRAHHPLLELLVLFGYVALGAITLVLTTAAVERLREEESVGLDGQRDRDREAAAGGSLAREQRP